MSSTEQDTTDNARETQGSKLPLGLTLNVGYIISIQGGLTAGFTILSLIAAICVAAERSKSDIDDLYCDHKYTSTYDFFVFVCVSSFICGLCYYLVALISLLEKLPAVIPWKLLGLGWTAVYGIFYFSGSCALASTTKICNQGAFQAGTVFGFACFVILCVSFLFLFLDYRRERATGSKKPDTETTTDKPFEQY